MGAFELGCPVVVFWLVGAEEAGAAAGCVETILGFGESQTI